MSPNATTLTCSSNISPLGFRNRSVHIEQACVGSLDSDMRVRRICCIGDLQAYV